MQLSDIHRGQVEYISIEALTGNDQEAVPARADHNIVVMSAELSSDGAGSIVVNSFNATDTDVRIGRLSFQNMNDTQIYSDPMWGIVRTLKKGDSIRIDAGGLAIDGGLTVVYVPAD